MAFSKIEFQPAIVLHRRKYQESSLLIDLLTQDYGKVALVARGARKSKDRSGLIQPFQLLQVSWQSRSELGTLTQIELLRKSHEFSNLPWSTRLQGTALICGLYLNELITRVCQRGIPVPGLLQIYMNSITALECSEQEARILRLFEWQLIQICGYGFDFHKTHSGENIKEDQQYVFQEHVGLSNVPRQISNAISGKSLLALHQGQWHDNTALKDAKLLFNQVLKPLAGSKPFASRKLYSGLKSQYKP